MAAKKVQYGLGEEAPKKPLRWLYLPFMLLLGLGGMVLATQRIAAFFEYQAALGQPWGIALGLSWYAPWSAFVWQERFGASDTYGFINQAIVHSQALFLLPQFVIIGVWLCFQKKLRSNANLHGSARWAEERQRLVLERQQRTARDAHTEWIAYDWPQTRTPIYRPKAFRPSGRVRIWTGIFLGRQRGAV